MRDSPGTWIAEPARRATSGGTPCRLELHRAAAGSVWGWWRYGDTNVHTFSGLVTGQVDNLGSGTVNHGVIVD